MIVTLNLSPVETVGVFHCNLFPRLHAYLSSDCSSIDFLCANWWPIKSGYWPGSCQSISVGGWWVGINYSEVDWQYFGSAFVFQLKCSSVIAMCGLLQFVYLTPVETLQSGPHSTLVPRLLAKLSSDWSGIGVTCVNRSPMQFVLSALWEMWRVVSWFEI